MVRYRKIGYVELNVSDLAKSRQFYEDIVGLEFVDQRDDAVFFRCDDDPYSIVLHQHSSPGHKVTGLMLEDDSQFDVLHERLREVGAPYLELTDEECARKKVARATRMVEPYSGARLEFYVLAANSISKAFESRHTKIRRLGHVVFATPKQSECVAYFRDVLNFRTSDAIGEVVTFMRPFPSPYHHGLAVGRSQKPHLHHVNFMVSEFDDIGKAINRCNRNGVPIVFGPGRHIASGSAFLYFLDPDGMTLEYSFGMEEFDELDPRQPRVLPVVRESFDSWDAPQDKRFASLGEIEPTRF